MPLTPRGAKGRRAAPPGRAARTNKKRPRPSSAQFSREERDEALGLLAAAASLIASYCDEVDGGPLDADERIALRTDLGFLAEFVERANGGKTFDRNRRWSLLYELTKDARRRKTRPSPDEIARWRLMPHAYTTASKEASRACGLLARAVAARTRREWLELLVDAIAEVDADEMGDGKWFPEAFEATVLAHQREERRVFR